MGKHIYIPRVLLIVGLSFLSLWILIKPSYAKEPLPPKAEISKSLAELKELQESLDATEKRLTKTALTLANEEAFLSNNYFFIFMGIFTVFGAFGLIAFWAIQFKIDGRIEKKIQEEVASLKEKISFDSALAQASMYNNLSVTWWEIYYPHWMEDGKKFDAYSKYVSIARSLADKGLEACRTPAFKDYQKKKGKEQEYAWTINVKLQTNKIYHQTIEMMGSGKFDEDEKKELLESAKSCLKFSTDPRVSQNWYNLQETALFAQILLEEDKEKESAVKRLNKLIKGNTKPTSDFPFPPLKWRKQIRKTWEITKKTYSIEIDIEEAGE